DVLLLVVLFRRLADDDVFVVEDLPRVLVTREDLIRGSRVPINARRIIVEGPIETDGSDVSAGAGWMVEGQICGKSRDDGFDGPAIGGGSVRRAQSWRAFVRQQQVACEILRSGLLHLIETDETEEAIFKEREADHAAVLVSAVDRFFHAGVEMALRVQETVVVIFVKFPMNSIRTRLGLHQHDRAVTATEFGGEVVADNLELFDRGQRRALAMLIFRRIVVVDAVDLERRAARPRPVEIDRRAG